MYWQINDCWPVASWSSIDYYGNWKASHYTVKELYKPIKTLFFENNKQLEVHIVSDELIDKKVKLKLKTINFDGEVLNSVEKEIVIKSNTSKVYFSENLDKILSGKNKTNTIVVAELINENILVFDESIYFFEVENNLKLTKPDFNYSVSKNEEGQFLVEVETNVLAKDVRFSTAVEGRFSNNYFDMIPNKKYTIYFTSKVEITLDQFKENFEIISLFDSY